MGWRRLEASRGGRKDCTGVGEEVPRRKRGTKGKEEPHKNKTRF